MSISQAWKLLATLLFLAILSGCESKEEQLQDSFKHMIGSAEIEIQQLTRTIEARSITNGRVLEHYAQEIKQKSPQYTELADALALNATTQGQLYQGLITRFEQLKKTTVTEDNYSDLSSQLYRLREATSVNVFGDALTDPINVLADLSQGSLARVGAISKDAENKGQGDDFGAGSQLIGNPQYGQWQTNNSGMSFWMWYGMYRMLDDLFDDIEYGRWSKHRRYSYYNDYGRYRYSSPKQLKKQSQLMQRTKQSYKTQGKQFSSPYATKRTGAAKLSRASHTPSRSSSFSSRSSYSSKNQGSMRNSSQRTSRGISRGK